MIFFKCHTCVSISALQKSALNKNAGFLKDQRDAILCCFKETITDRDKRLKNKASI